MKRLPSFIAYALTSALMLAKVVGAIYSFDLDLSSRPVGKHLETPQFDLRGQAKVSLADHIVPLSQSSAIKLLEGRVKNIVPESDTKRGRWYSIALENTEDNEDYVWFSIPTVKITTYLSSDDNKSFLAIKSGFGWGEQEIEGFSRPLFSSGEFDIKIRKDRPVFVLFYLEEMTENVRPSNYFVIRSKTSYYEKILVDMLPVMVYLGVIFTLILYNCFVYWQTKQPEFLWYVLMEIFFYVIYGAADNDAKFLSRFFVSLNFWYAQGIGLAFGLFFVNKFITSYLRLNHNSKLFLMFNCAAIISFANPVSCLLNAPRDILLLSFFPYIVVLVSGCIYLGIRRSNHQAWLVLATFSPIVVIGIFTILEQAFQAENDKNFMYLGFLVEAFIFSLLLSHRYANSIKNEKEYYRLKISADEKLLKSAEDLNHSYHQLAKVFSIIRLR